MLGCKRSIRKNLTLKDTPERISTFELNYILQNICEEFFVLVPSPLESRIIPNVIFYSFRECCSYVIFEKKLVQLLVNLNSHRFFILFYFF
jgi:hypothetical protein